VSFPFSAFFFLFVEKHTHGAPRIITKNLMPVNKQKPAKFLGCCSAVSHIFRLSLGEKIQQEQPLGRH
jgi:hypothetical protein